MPALEAIDPALQHVLDGEVDGRRRRTLRTNAALVEATIRLFRSGATSPTANAVAREASVSARSLFAHFADVPLLYQAAIRRVLDDMLTSQWPAIRGGLSERIDALVAHHAQACEQWLPFQRAAATLRYEHAELWQGCQSARDQLRDRLGAVFAPELAGLDEEEAGTLLDALTALLDWDAWGKLRHDRDLSVARARSVWTLGLSRLLMVDQPPARALDTPRLVAVN
jgi:TetR/AcrR family transcriptional regulator, regulator of autoinduction and epiphytic fitness